MNSQGWGRSKPVDALPPTHEISDDRIGDIFYDAWTHHATEEEKELVRQNHRNSVHRNRAYLAASVALTIGLTYRGVRRWKPDARNFTNAPWQTCILQGVGWASLFGGASILAARQQNVAPAVVLATRPQSVAGRHIRTQLMNDRLPPPTGWQMLMIDFYKNHPELEKQEVAPMDDQIAAIVARENKAPSQLPFTAMDGKQKLEQRQRIAQLPRGAFDDPTYTSTTDAVNAMIESRSMYPVRPSATPTATSTPTAASVVAPASKAEPTSTSGTIIAPQSQLKATSTTTTASSP